MKDTGSSKQITTMTFIGMTCALVASVRNIPDVAATSWTMIFYMLVAVLLYAFPISLISGEFAGMFPQKGGPELWVSNALGKKWGFVVSWLLWVQMFPGMVMVASALAPLFGNIIDNVPLGLNSKFTLVVILVVYWIITFLNLKFDMAKIGGKVGVWLGLY
ncbi:MAG: amino acid permease, partial [Enterococcus faecium]|nr:amino acid permease [Enterococcus faecium]